LQRHQASGKPSHQDSGPASKSHCLKMLGIEPYHRAVGLSDQSRKRNHRQDQGNKGGSNRELPIPTIDRTPLASSIVNEAAVRSAHKWSKKSSARLSTRKRRCSQGGQLWAQAPESAPDCKVATESGRCIQGHSSQLAQKDTSRTFNLNRLPSMHNSPPM
jgi:hypothetical protein